MRSIHPKGEATEGSEAIPLPPKNQTTLWVVFFLVGWDENPKSEQREDFTWVRHRAIARGDGCVASTRRARRPKGASQSHSLRIFFQKIRRSGMRTQSPNNVRTLRGFDFDPHHYRNPHSDIQKRTIYTRTDLGKELTLTLDPFCCIWHTSECSSKDFDSNLGLSDSEGRWMRSIHPKGETTERSKSIPTPPFQYCN